MVTPNKSPQATMISWSWFAGLLVANFWDEICWDNQHNQHHLRNILKMLDKCSQGFVLTWSTILLGLKVSMRWCVALNDCQIIFSQCSGNSIFSSTTKYIQTFQNRLQRFPYHLQKAGLLTQTQGELCIDPLFKPSWWSLEPCDILWHSGTLGPARCEATACGAAEALALPRKVTI